MWSTSWRTLSSLTVRPVDSDTAAAHLRGGSITVDLAQYRVQQRGELDGLAVGAADQRRRDPVAGSRHLPDQLDAVGAMVRRLASATARSVVTVTSHSPAAQRI